MVDGGMLPFASVSDLHSTERGTPISRVQCNHNGLFVPVDRVELITENTGQRAILFPPPPIGTKEPAKAGGQDKGVPMPGWTSRYFDPVLALNRFLRIEDENEVRDVALCCTMKRTK